MIDKTLSYLDYLKLLDIIKLFSSTPFVDQAISAMRPLQDREEIEDRLDRIEAILEVIRWDGKLPLSHIPDVRQAVKRISIEDSLLEVVECIMLSEFLRACEDLLRFLKKAFVKKPFTDLVIGKIDPLTAVYRRIVKTVNVEGFIEDTASYELSRIRADLFSLRDRARKRLEKIMEREPVRPVLQDSYISLRNGRYVIPMKPNFNEAFQGIVHDYSHSLKTSFVEPMEVVELNNTINVLEKEEKEEEKVILKELTDSVRRFLPALEADLDAIRELDFYGSIAGFSAEYGCVRPEVGRDMELAIKHAINPFIRMSRKDETVPIDISMDEIQHVMIISGPNAGGKTAALKTVGLLSAMAQTGLFIPAAEAPRVPLFSRIFAIIGDEQDIAMELCSFTAHMNSIKEVYTSARGSELILIDEIGGNTEPQEASALSMAIMDAFVDKGCKLIVTTHLNILKAYGYTRPFAINVATAFDPTAMKSQYRLLYGTAGYSNAINVAKSLDLPQEIIEKSLGYLGKQEYMLNDLITALETDKKRVEGERGDLARLRQDVKKRISLLREKKDEYIRKLELKCESRLAGLEEELEAARKEIAKKEKASIGKAREKVRGLRSTYTRGAVQEQEEIRVGDYVKVKTLGSKGYVVDMDKTGDTYEVVIGNVRAKVRRGLMDKVTTEVKPARETRVEIDVERVEEPVLNLIGMRVDEGLKELDRFVDRAIVQGTPRVKILHGIGTGRLMSAVKAHLEELNFVGEIKRDQRNPGVTLVEFR
jgi:DNA mismatch repair protein MutS2